MDYDERKEALENARRAGQEPSPVSNSNNKSESIRNTMKTAKNIAKAVTPMGFLSLLTKVSIFKDIPLACAFGFAILKDILDLALGFTVILPAILSILCSIFIFMMMLLSGGINKTKMARNILKGSVLIGGSIIDSLPGIDFFPFETITVLIVYLLILSERASAERIKEESA
jgi:hypothetical protein